MKPQHSLRNPHPGTHRLWRIIPLLVLALGTLPLAPMPLAAATFFGTPQFAQQYAMGEAITPNFWGPLATAREPQNGSLRRRVGGRHLSPDAGVRAVYPRRTTACAVLR